VRSATQSDGVSGSRPTPADENLPAEVGEVIGGYRLDGVIGHGGMGCVYSGTHVRLGRKAAIKVLKKAYAADTEYVARFFDEARVVNAIRHPNIIDIFDFLESESPLRVACIMELLEGPTLRELMKRQGLTPIQSVNLTLQMADALRKVHEISVVHRDLKPDNLVIIGDPSTDLSRVPSLKVLDFGIAKVQVTGAERTTPGLVLGTPAYMSPEQVSGQKVSSASDVYSLAAVFYEMLAGKRLFLGEPMAIFRQKLMGEIPPIELPMSVPGMERAGALIRGCVAFEKERRLTLPAIEVELREIVADLERPSRSRDTRAELRSRAPTATAVDLGQTQAMPTPPPMTGAAPADTVATFQGDLVTNPSKVRIAPWLVAAVILAVGAGTALGLKLTQAQDKVVVEAIPQAPPPAPPRPTGRSVAPSEGELEAPEPTLAAPPALETEPMEAKPQVAEPQVEPQAPAPPDEPPPTKRRSGSKENPKRGDKKVLRKEDRPLEQRPDKAAPLRKDDMVPW
jgi:serine/threonine protein kinase